MKDAEAWLELLAVLSWLAIQEEKYDPQKCQYY